MYDLFNAGNVHRRFERKKVRDHSLFYKQNIAFVIFIHHKFINWSYTQEYETGLGVI